jgi:hypothetical protein
VADDRHLPRLGRVGHVFGYNANWTYLVMAVDVSGAELARSNRVGEEDFATDIP